MRINNESEVCIRIEDLINGLGPEGKREFAKTVAFDDTLIECMCQWLVTGQVDWDSEYGAWWSMTTGPVPILEKARLALMPLMDDIAAKVIQDLVRERDAQASQCEQWRDRCWQVERYWRDSKLPDHDIDYGKPTITREQVRELLEKWKEDPCKKKS